jgi:peptidoglycan/LPS O-acetylase OafA/YrhL
VYIGQISYGIYLFHQLINGMVHDLIFGTLPSFQNLPTALATLLAFLVTCLVAQGTYRAFEKRFIDFGHKYSYSDE